MSRLSRPGDIWLGITPGARAWLARFRSARARRRFRSGIDFRDALTGKPFRRTICAIELGEDRVLVSVAVSPEPRVVRSARRVRFVAEFIEGWQGAVETGQSTRLLERKTA